MFVFNTALVGADVDVVFAHDLHEVDIGAGRRELFMMSDGPAECRDRLIRDRITQEYGMGHPGIDEVHIQAPALYIQAYAGFKTKGLGHLNGHVTALDPGADNAGKRLKSHGVRCNALPVGEQARTSGPVAAHLGLAAVGIEDAEGEISVCVRIQDYYPVRPDAGLQCAKALCKRRPVNLERLIDIVHHDEIVACTAILVKETIISLDPDPMIPCALRC
jgi:hypothetical protein